MSRLITALTASTFLFATSATVSAQQRLSGEGESCTKTDDCVTPLVCRDHACVDPYSRRRRRVRPRVRRHVRHVDDVQTTRWYKSPLGWTGVAVGLGGLIAGTSLHIAAGFERVGAHDDLDCQIRMIEVIRDFGARDLYHPFNHYMYRASRSLRTDPRHHFVAPWILDCTDADREEGRRKEAAAQELETIGYVMFGVTGLGLILAIVGFTTYGGQPLDEAASQPLVVPPLSASGEPGLQARITF